jgi:diacylglycerol kinase family enzyme
MTNPERLRFIDRMKTIEKRMLVVVNPMSRKSSELASRTRSLVRREGMDLEETSTDHPDDIGSTVQFWSKRFGGSRVIMVFGGDGAINQVINNVMLSRSNNNVVLVPIPAGTANDFCRAVGFDSVESALNAMVDFNIQTVDLIKMEIEGTGRNVKYCSNVFAIGLDGDLAHRSQKYKRFGIPGYWYASLKKAAVAMFKGVETYRVHIKANGFEYSGDLVDGIFSNINRYGHDFLIAPDARPDDGKMHIAIAKPMNAARTFVTGLMLLKGKHGRMSAVETSTCESADVYILDDLYAQEDGEVCFYPRGTKIHLSVAPQALNVIAPPLPSLPAPGAR